MYEEENDLEADDRIVECPYDSSHQVCFSRMARHLGKCRKNFYVSEKAICPFNKNHTINVPELNYHKQTCPNKPEDFEVDSEQHQVTDEQRENGANSEPKAKGKENGSCFDSYFASDIESTGCVNGRPEGGGIHNHNSVKEQNDEVACDTPTQKEDFVVEQVNGRCEFVVEDSETSNSDVVADQPPNHNAAIERQLSQSESDTASSESELSMTEAGNGPEGFDQTSQVVHFDYKKFAPSPEEKEEFLKLISQGKENQSCNQVALNQIYGPPQWHQGYETYIPQQFPVPNTGYHTGGMPHAYVTFTNGYPMMPPVPAQPPYAHGPYVFPQPVQSSGGFIPGPNHGGNYDYGGNYRHRPHYHRSYKRRGYPGSYSHPRYSNNNNNYHSYNPYNGHNSTDTDSNSTTSSTPSDSGSVEENGYSLKIDNLGQTYDEQTVNGGNMKKTSAKQQLKQRLPGVSSKNGMKVEKAKVNFEQFVKIEKMEAGKQVNGKIQHVEVFAYNCQPNHNTTSNDGTKSDKDKQIRKLRKKLNEVLSLEEKKLGGAKLDCDQLKKLTRKREIEDQLAVLQIN